MGSFRNRGLHYLRVALDLKEGSHKDFNDWNRHKVANDMAIVADISKYGCRFDKLQVPASLLGLQPRYLFGVELTFQRERRPSQVWQG
jgi:hypothetical protein